MKYTFCLQTCGEETEAECLAAIEPQRSRFVLQENRNVTPIIKSLRKMVDQCETEYLIPLDADMVLKPDFMDRIEKAVQENERKDKWHSLLFPLWDTLTCEKIYALKVCKSSLFKQFPFEDTPCPDIKHYQDLKAAGYEAIDLTKQNPIGKHIVRGNLFCYAKYLNLYMTLRTNPKIVLESHFKGGSTHKERAKGHFDFFMDRYKQTGNNDYLCCVAGMYKGLTSKLDFTGKDLSNRKIEVQPDAAPDLFRTWYRHNRSERIFA